MLSRDIMPTPSSFIAFTPSRISMATSVSNSIITAKNANVNGIITAICSTKSTADFISSRTVPLFQRTTGDHPHTPSIALARLSSY